MKKPFAEIAVPLPIPGTLFYRIPVSLQEEARIGKRALVPIKSRLITGYILSLVDSVPESRETKEIVDIIDREPLFDIEDLMFYRWAANYYISPVGMALKKILPGGINIETRCLLQITSKGKELLAMRAADELTLRMLERISKAPVELKALLKVFPKEGIHSRINTMEKEGLILIENSLPRPRVKIIRRHLVELSPKGKEAVEAASGQGRIRLTSSQKGLLKEIGRMGKTPIDALKKRFPNINERLSRLQRKGLVIQHEVEHYRDPLRDEVEEKQAEPLWLTDEQNRTLGSIVSAIDAKRFSSFLIFGVTGSGKTEIYLHAMAEALKRGRRGIVLVPEISLTHQLVRRFRSRFGDRVAVLHSGLTAGERYDTWRKVQTGKVDIVIGARSALFAPVKELGLIVVDEEHDASYKQDAGFMYNARDLALVRGKLTGSAVVLGSATPSIESFHNAKGKGCILFRLTKRATSASLPRIEIIDMRKEGASAGRFTFLSKILIQTMYEHLRKGEQILLFLNRRGFATFLSCQSCGFVFKCPNCSVTLVYHLSTQSVMCHYCGYAIAAPPLCPACSGSKIGLWGAGTETLEKEIHRAFPEAEIGRLDSDMGLSREGQRRLLKRLERGEIQIMVGTQMISKGHDYPNVTLVGVISADLSLNIPDFRASERTFQILTQVSGRAGRGALPGRVLIQTYNPQHYSILASSRQDFISFYQKEIAMREEAGYPPFVYLINLRITGNSESRTARYAELLGELCRILLPAKKQWKETIRALGPNPAPLTKLKGRHRWQILLKGKRRQFLHDFARRLIAEAREFRLKGVDFTVDVDPVNLL